MFPDARLTASYYNCKYVETSASLNHHVDNLLVGILSQIRLKLNPDKLLQQIEKSDEKKTKNRHGSLKSAKGIFNKLFNRQKSLSCDHLYDLWPQPKFTSKGSWMKRENIHYIVFHHSTFCTYKTFHFISSSIILTENKVKQMIPEKCMLQALRWRKGSAICGALWFKISNREWNLMGTVALRASLTKIKGTRIQDRECNCYTVSWQDMQISKWTFIY